MATIRWSFFCDHAFLDVTKRLCIIGLTPKLVLPTVPVNLTRTVVVASLDAPEGERLDLGFRIVTPHGVVGPKLGEDAARVESVGGYLFFTLRDVPIAEEGLHRIEIILDGAVASSIDLPVVVSSAGPSSQVH
jgi:hypothetical protein